MTMVEHKQPLAGLRVADFSWFAAGPVAARTLADYGAEVVRVESETRIDSLRIVQPLAAGKTGYNVSGYYNNYNAGKMNVALNLNMPRGRELAHELIRWADVFITNFTPRVIEGWGLTYEELVKAQPDIIAVYQPMQGFDGPHRDFLGFGAVLGPVTGYSYLSGFPNRPPVGLGTNYPDYVINPGHTVVAIMAALRHRRKTGRGQHIELAQMESAVSALGPALMDYTVNGRVQNRAGNRLPHAAPHGAFPCAGEDRWCAIAVITDEEWQALCDAVGHPEWRDDPRFATLPARKENEDKLESLLSEWTRTKSAEDVMESLQAAGVAAGVVQNAEDMLDKDAHLKERGYYVYLDHPEAGRTAYDGSGFRLTKTPGSLRSPACMLGQHTHHVAKEILKLDDEEISQLIIDQVLY
jgi:crotonobetainyl-CoA:carnitine CoA-transferase CaiB-like acyl-CoA transferase